MTTDLPAARAMFAIRGLAARANPTVHHAHRLELHALAATVDGAVCVTTSACELLFASRCARFVGFRAPLHDDPAGRILYVASQLICACGRFNHDDLPTILQAQAKAIGWGAVETVCNYAALALRHPSTRHPGGGWHEGFLVGSDDPDATVI